MADTKAALAQCPTGNGTQGFWPVVSIGSILSRSSLPKTVREAYFVQLGHPPPWVGRRGDGGCGTRQKSVAGLPQLLPGFGAR